MRCACRIPAAAMLLLGLCAPPSALADAARLNLDEFKGHVVYVDFWASWCGPCRESFPWMQDIQETYGGKGLKVLAINLDRDRGDAERFLRRFHTTFEIRFDPDGTLARRLHVEGMPTSVLIDKDGTIRFTHVGFRLSDSALYDYEIKRILGEERR